MSNIQYYSLDEIDKYKSQYYIIFGERSNGKSYAVDKRMIDNFFTKGEEFVICKRYEEDMKAKIVSTYFEPLEEYVKEKYQHKIRFYNGRWYVYHIDSDGQLQECTVMGYALALNICDRTKGAQYPRVTTILLEEFMSQNCTYLVDEINLFINLVSTITRNRTNVKIFLLGNAISKYSPYAAALDVKLHRMKHGEIIEREYTNKKGFRTKFVIQRTKNVDVFDNDENEDKIVYNVFGNSGVGAMITTGEFETHAYNREINNVTFSENIRFLPKKESKKDKYVILGKQHRTGMVIKYTDYYYRIYRHGETFGFREIDESEINEKNTSYIINNKKTFKGVRNLPIISKYMTKDRYLDNFLNDVIKAVQQDFIIFLDDDNGEDVISAFAQSGVRR